MIDAYLEPDCHDKATLWYMNRMDEVRDEALDKLSMMEIAAINGDVDLFKYEYDKENCEE